LKDGELPGHTFHLVLLSRDTQGYKNLLKVVSSGYLGACLKEVPTVAFEELTKRASGLLCMSACLKGEFAFLVRRLRKLWGLGPFVFDGSHSSSICEILDALKSHVVTMQEIFGKDHFYIELVDNRVPGQAELIEDLVACADFLQVPIVATGD